MKLNVDDINSIEPQYVMRAVTTLNINVNMSTDQMKAYLSEIWESIGDDGFNDYFNAEGYELVKKKINT